MSSKILALLLLPACAGAQTGATNQGTLFVSGATTLHVEGSFTNAATAALTNNGNFYIRGNLTNDQASMSAGLGTLHLNGNSAQSVNGTQPYRCYHLTTNNAAGIALNNDLSIAGAHNFVAGIITPSSAPNYLVYESGASWSDAADSRHVRGWVKKRGATAFSFPVGNGSWLRPIGLTNLSASSEFDARYEGPTPSASSVQSPIVSVNGGEHWTVNRVSGGTAQVALNWDHAKIPFPNYVVADIRAVQFSTSWINAGGSAAGSTTATGSITSNALSSFGRFALGSISFVIPIRFVHIGAARETAGVVVRWQTANEAELLRFDVERSFDGQHFEAIGRLPASNLPDAAYAFTDAQAPARRLFYRVRSLEASGLSRYTSVALVAPAASGSFQLLNGAAAIRLQGREVEAGTYHYRLIAPSGQVVSAGQFRHSGAVVTIDPPSALPPGIYQLQLDSGSYRQTLSLRL